MVYKRTTQLTPSLKLASEVPFLVPLLLSHNPTLRDRPSNYRLLIADGYLGPAWNSDRALGLTQIPRETSSGQLRGKKKYIYLSLGVQRWGLRFLDEAEALHLLSFDSEVPGSESRHTEV